MSRQRLVENRSYIVGRTGELRLDDPTASAKHAELVLLNGQIYITDLGSTNGTYIWREGRWERFHEGYVNAETRMAFGRCVRSVAQLLACADEAGGPGAQTRTNTALRALR